ncbi:MAG: hypothetical protein ABFS16_12390 [Bacteroidota bacterium]
MNIKKILLSLLIVINAFLLLAQETVVLRTDRDTYIAGESVWIRANCFKSGTSLPSDLSNVIYAEVLNDKNEPVVQLKLNAENGSCSTQFMLPDNLQTGNYVLRGYTKWLQNYNSELFFTKNIVVINPFSKNPFPGKENIYNSDTLFFYPEGGKIILNQKNKIAIQAFDKFGNRKPVAGGIFSPSGDTLFTVSTSSEGFAVFNLTPEAIGIYRFKSEKSDISVPLPEISPQGVNLQLQEENNQKLTFRVAAENLNSLNGTIHIVSSIGALLKKYPVSLKENESVSVDNAEFPPGYLYALLIDEKGEILSSRYFVAHGQEDSNLLKVTTDKQNYSGREPVSLQITNQQNLKNVSVSVTKKCLLNTKSQLSKVLRPDNIAVQTLNEFANNNVSLNDILLLFTPADKVLANPNRISFIPEMKGEIISGTIIDLDNQQPIANKVFILSFISQCPTIEFSKTDSSGKFYFNANRVGEHEIVIQPFERDSSNLNYKVNLDLAFSPEYPENKIQPLFIEAKNISKINKAIINMQVNALYDPYDSYSFLSKPAPGPGCFYGEPEISILTSDFIEMPTMEEVFREIVPSTQLVKKEGRFNIKISETDALVFTDDDSFCMVDGVPIKNQHNIFKMNPAKVEKIDVINQNYFIQDYKLGRFLNITTTEGDMSEFDFDKSLFRQSFNGYAPSYIFNSPDYSVDSLRNSRIPDFRNLLYWNPDITFNENNSGSVSFYTSDESAEYVVVVEGINSNGVIERRLTSFTVSDK